MKKIVRLTESDLHNIIKETVNNILKETRLDYDEDNFSGRHFKKLPDGYIENYDYYLDDPLNGSEIESELESDAYYEDKDLKDLENEYSWDLFDKKPIANGVGGYYKVNKNGVEGDIERAFNKRKEDKKNSKFF